VALTVRIDDVVCGALPLILGEQFNDNNVSSN
jgi:hypothetical protein